MAPSNISGMVNYPFKHSTFQELMFLPSVDLQNEVNLNTTERPTSACVQRYSGGNETILYTTWTEKFIADQLYPSSILFNGINSVSRLIMSINDAFLGNKKA